MSRRSLALPALLALATLASHPAAARAEAVAPEALIAQKAPAIASVKLVLRWGEREVPQEARGTLVDPSGLLVIADGWLGGDDAKAQDLKVLFGADPKEWPAVLVARDRILHLAFLQVIGLEKPVAAIDLSKGGEVKVGQDLHSVWRDVRGFDYAPGLKRHYVSGRVEKPRLLWALAGDSIDAGMPLFDAEGRPVGIASQQESSAGTGEEDAETRVFALPLADVLRSLEQAKKRVPDAVAKAGDAGKDAEAGMGAPAMGEAPAGDGGMGGDAPKAPGAPEQPK
jgi:S1-C subfamily serine protease